MTNLAIGIGVALVSMLTLYSGFGFGTILMPLIALFFPVALAIAITALVHFLNNCFKLLLLWNAIEWNIVALFGIPAIGAALVGAWLLTYLSQLPILSTYTLYGLKETITPIKVVVGFLLIFFASLERHPLRTSNSFSPRLITIGGLLSGFFGGLSGHQGAFRSAFLITTIADKKAFIASCSAIAALVDLSRLIVYGLNMPLFAPFLNLALIGPIVLAAFIGTLLGKMLLKNVSFRLIRALVTGMLYSFGILFILGVL